VKPRDVRGLLLVVPVPDELGAQRRAWSVVRSAFEEREPVAWPRRHARPLLALAAGLAVIAASFSPPGRALVQEVRERIGVERAAPALFSLPAVGRLLVVSEDGPWIVREKGAKRLLGSYRQAAWSPSGRFVVAARENELVTLEQDGDVRWSLARRKVSLARWGGNRVDTRIAYLSRSALRVVAGDGTGDRRFARPVEPVAPAWRPGVPHVLAFVERGGRLVVAETDSRRRLWSRRLGRVVRLEWSSDGRLLLVQGRRFLRVFSAKGRLRYDLLGREAAPLVDVTFAPGGRSVAFVQRAANQGHVWIIPRLRPDGSAARRIFVGQGPLTDIAWSPDGRWLLAAWEEADQWVFLRTAPGGKIRAVDNVTEQFGGSSPSIAGWCCP
jgi:WD40 repeat protein